MKHNKIFKTLENIKKCKKMIRNIKRYGKKNIKTCLKMIRQNHSKCRKREKTRRADGQGPYFRSLDHLSKSSEVTE